MFENKSRFAVVQVILGLFFIIIIVRLNLLSFQGMQKKNKNFSTPKMVFRGTIFDRNGIPLATNHLVSSVFANPKQFDEKEIKIKMNRLSKLLNIPKKSLIKKLDLDKSFNWLKRKIPNEIGEEIKSLKMKGISVINEYKRSYPHDTLASQLLGFTGIDDTGLEGLEYSFNTTLKPIKNKNVDQKIVYGNHIYLSIDYNIQKISEKVIKKGVINSRAEGGSVIILDSSNGEILSMANYPDYDNNDFASYPKNYYRNVAITDYYEPGSVFKIFTAAIFLEENLYQQKETFFCPGKIVIYDREIKCTAKHGYLTFREVLKKSCNVGIIKMSMRISSETFYKYLKQFNFGKKTGIQLAGESHGLLRPFRELTMLSKSMTSFGYEIALTPLQIVMAAASLFNQGILYKPLIVKKITNKNGHIVKSFQPVIKEKTISASTSKRLMELLKSVLEPGGTGAKARIKGLNISGKTGTIDIYNHQKGIYDENQVNTAFIGFVPLYEKRLVVLIMVRKPSVGQKIASHVVAPLFKKLINELLKKGFVN